MGLEDSTHPTTPLEEYVMTYTIQNNEIYYWTGRDRNHQQVMLGLLAPDILIYRFDMDGNYLKCERAALINNPKKDDETGIYVLDSTFMARFSSELVKVKHLIGYQARTIRINEFFDLEHYVGILPYPSDYQNFLDSPDGFSDEEKRIYESHVSRWDKDGNFVFCWGEEYWMNSEGEIESS
jgi:hypothetical protein